MGDDGEVADMREIGHVESGPKRAAGTVGMGGGRCKEGGASKLRTLIQREIDSEIGYSFQRGPYNSDPDNKRPPFLIGFPDCGASQFEKPFGPTTSPATSDSESKA